MNLKNIVHTGMLTAGLLASHGAHAQSMTETTENNDASSSMTLKTYFSHQDVNAIPVSLVTSADTGIEKLTLFGQKFTVGSGPPSELVVVKSPEALDKAIFVDYTGSRDTATSSLNPLYILTPDRITFIGANDVIPRTSVYDSPFRNTSQGISPFLDRASADGNTIYIRIDSSSLYAFNGSAAAVPEPSTIALGALGVAALAASRLRKKK